MGASLQRILILCHKEFLAVFKDPSSRIILFTPIIIQTLLFGYAATFDLNDVPYAVLDQDRSGTSRELIALIESSGVFTRIADLGSPQEMAALINRKRVLVVVHIPQDFERSVMSGGAAVQVIVDGRNSNTAATASGYLRVLVERFNRQWTGEHGGTVPAVTIETRAWYNENLESRWMIVPGLITVLCTLQVTTLAALSVARERELGTFDQLLVTPLRPGEIMVGKAVPPIVIGLLQSTVILLLALLWFEVPFAGSMFTLYTGLLVFTISLVGIGLVISAFSLTMQQAMLYSFALLMPIMLLSGFTSPIKNMPEWLQVTTYANPMRYGIAFVRRVYLEGADLALIVHELWPLALIAALTLPAAAWLFRHRLA